MRDALSRVPCSGVEVQLAVQQAMLLVDVVLEAKNRRRDYKPHLSRSQVQHLKFNSTSMISIYHEAYTKVALSLSQTLCT
jgi:hypothetical protein